MFTNKTLSKSSINALIFFNIGYFLNAGSSKSFFKYERNLWFIIILLFLLKIGLEKVLTLLYIALVEQPKSGLINNAYKFILLFKYLIFPFPYKIEVLFRSQKTTSDPIFDDILVIYF